MTDNLIVLVSVNFRVRFTSFPNCLQRTAFDCIFGPAIDLGSNKIHNIFLICYFCHSTNKCSEYKNKITKSVLSSIFIEWVGRSLINLLQKSVGSRGFSAFSAYAYKQWHSVGNQ